MMLTSRDTELYIMSGARTPFGTYGGSLKDVDAVTLGTIAAKGAIDRAQIPADTIDFSVVGGVIPSSVDYAYLARHVSLAAGLSTDAPSLTVNRLCGSGLQAVISAAQALILGEGQVALAGGTENMSQSPYALRHSRWGVKNGAPELDDTLQSTLTDVAIGLGMGMTAENLAHQYEIRREDQDAFAVRSHQLAHQAAMEGLFREEMVPVSLNRRGKMTVVDADEHIRPEVSLQALGTLRPAFLTEGGSVTAGNSSGINDGAAMLIVATGEFVRSHGLKPMARIVSYAVAGVDPSIMGIGPVPASQLALGRAGLDLQEIGRIEINEAFAAQYLAVEEQLQLDRQRTNVHGGAIALGHPVGASGARLLLTLALEMQRSKVQYGLASLCIGGGQGIAMVIENL